MKLIKKLFAFFWDKSLLIFAVIGAVNTAISWAGSFVLQNYAGFSLFGATALMFAVCSVGSFYFNRRFSFQSKAPLVPSILRFSTIVAVCFLLSHAANYLLMPWLRAQLMPGISDMWYSAIQILGIQVVFTLLNYVGQRLWAFGYKKTDDPDGQASPEPPPQ